MIDRPPPQPTGDDAEAHFMQWVWRACARVFADTPTVTAEADEKSIRFHAAPAGLGGAGGWNFDDPLVYDSERNYTKNKVVYVGEENLAVTDGVIQEDLSVVYATPGLWVCYKNTVDPDDYHVPTFTMPAEADAETLYWYPIWTNVCG